MEFAVHTETHTRFLFGRLNMNIGGTPLYRVAQNSGDNLCHRCVGLYFGFWLSCGDRCLRLLVGLQRSFVFRECFTHFPAQVFVLLNNACEVGLAYDEQFVRHTYPRRNELERVECLQVFWIDNSHLKRSILYGERDEAVVACRLLRNEFKHLVLYLSGRQDAIRHIVLLSFCFQNLLDGDAALLEKRFD